jgi:acetyl/propionyl-CoA carboxylase alpha subunit
MRVVAGAGALAGALELTRGEARAAFGDDELYLERFIAEPRHVEAQILADGHGRVAFLGERECSVQRRHQKVLEETPSPALTPERRAALGEAACAIARAAGYVSAGTVEFIVDREGAFYFLEMNTRLQVEHPITEAVTGLDLVAEQVRVARGEPLSWTAEEAAPRGAALECRIYAEDPLHGFLPSTGAVQRLRWPSGPGVRIDAGIYRGYQVPVHYDPILAKIVAWGRDREHVVARMERALDETVITGVRTNVGLHRWILRHQAFRAGRYDTGFLERHFRPDVLDDDLESERIALLAAALHEWRKSEQVTLPRRRGGQWRWTAAPPGPRR